MSTSPNSGDDNNLPPSPSTVILLFATMADTTWRLFIPSVGLTIAGLMLDKQLKTTPWFMVAGIILGCTIAILLILAQMRKVKKQ